MSESIGVSRALAQHAANIRFRDLPPSATAEAERAILDWLGATLAGARERPAQIVANSARALGTSDEATAFGAGRMSAAGAAMANGAAAHALEVDDVHKGSTMHAAAPVISAALAVAEREHASGELLLAAVVVGYDIALRIGEAVNPIHYRFWHPTGTAATFGSAAAAGSIQSLDGDAMLAALGSAGTQASGLWEFNADGAMSKVLHPAKAAFNGVLSADLARAGFTGATRILEGDRGFGAATAPGADLSRALVAVGSRWKITENCHKIHSCCGHTHSAIDNALGLRALLGGSAAHTRVASIQLETYAGGYDIVREANPRTSYQGKFSLVYATCAALVHGAAGLGQFRDDWFAEGGVTEPHIARLMAITRVDVAPDLSARYPNAWPSRVTITLADGSVHQAAADYPRGNPENPVSTGDLRAKFTALVEPVLGGAAVTHALAFLDALPACDDVAPLVRDFATSLDQ